MEAADLLERASELQMSSECLFNDHSSYKEWNTETRVCKVARFYKKKLDGLGHWKVRIVQILVVVAW